MDQIKIGRFIAERRKNASLTHMQLAEKLGITDKAISKWERGLAMLDTSIMLELCDILSISVNELLNGEIIDMENNDQKKEQLLLDIAKELERKNKTIWISMWVIMIVSLTALLGGILVAAFLVQNETYKIIRDNLEFIKEVARFLGKNRKMSRDEFKVYYDKYCGKPEPNISEWYSNRLG